MEEYSKWRLTLTYILLYIYISEYENTERVINNRIIQDGKAIK